MPRKSNQQLVAEFRALLTDGAAVHFDAEGLAATKAYRGDLWRAFNELEERLNPLVALDRERKRRNEQ